MKLFNKKSKLIVITEVVIFTLALFGFLMLIAMLNGILVNESGIRWAGIYQLMIYLGIMDLGIILCLTDVIFSKTATPVRLAVFLGILYGTSMLYFTGAPINPLGSILNFTVYTLYFSMVAAIVLVFWYLYQFVVSEQYNRALKAYRGQSEK